MVTDIDTWFVMTSIRVLLKVLFIRGSIIGSYRFPLTASIEVSCQGICSMAAQTHALESHEWWITRVGCHPLAIKLTKKVDP